MRIYLKSSVIVVLFLILAACQTTTEDKFNPQKPYTLKKASYIGLYVGYSEVCAQFRGISTDNKILAYFVNEYRGNEWFETGYQRYGNFAGADRVLTFERCHFVNASLEHTYKNKNAPKISRKFKLTDVPHTLSINWADTNRETLHLFKLSQYGKNGRTKEFELDRKRLCSVDFLFKTNVSGTWDMECSNDETGTGTFQFDGKTNVTTGTGETSFGGPISFVMKRDKT